MADFRIYISDEASIDIIKIYKYKSENLLIPSTALKIVKKIREAIDSLDTFPLRHKVIHYEPRHSMKY